MATCVLVYGSTPKLSVGVESVENLPFYYTDDNGQYQGFVSDLIKLFADTIEVELVFDSFPIKRLFHELIQSSIDIKVPDNPKWQAELKKGVDIIYSDSFLSIRVGLVGFNGHVDTAFTEITNVSLPLGYTLVGLSEHQKNSFGIAHTNSIESCIKMVIKKRSMGCYANLAALRYYVRHKFPEQLDKVFVYRYFPEQIGTYHLSTSSRPDIIKKFNHFLNSHKAAVNTLKKQYGL